MTNSSTLCFSGHRYYLPSPDDEARLATAVETAWNDGYRIFISGMASGFDLAAAEAVVGMRSVMPGLRLIAAVPFVGQPREYSPVDLARYEALLSVADEVCVLSERYYPGCYYRRDDWMVERSGRIVCWYDGHASGTRYTVRRAVAAGLEVVNLFREPDALLFIDI